MAERWTAADIPDQSGRVAVVTGGNSGLGLVTARELCRAGASVVIACRNLEKGETAAGSIRAAVGGDVVVRELDLADLGSVERFAAGLLEERGVVDLLVNNAGVMAPPRRLTRDGFESQFGTNHLGHFALTGRLLAGLLGGGGGGGGGDGDGGGGREGRAGREVREGREAREGREGRVVTVSSGAHRTPGGIRFDDLQWEHGYNNWRAYGQSKLANLLFCFELQRRAVAAGAELKSLAAHPGYAATNLQFAGPSRWEAAVMRVTNAVFAQSAEMGALPVLYAAVETSLPGGTYVGPDGLFESRGYPHVVTAAEKAYDERVARRLWEVSEELTGVVYEWPAVAAA